MKNEPNAGIAYTLLGALEMLPYVPKKFPEKVRVHVQEIGVLEGAEPAEEAPAPSARKSTSRPWWKFWGPN